MFELLRHGMQDVQNAVSYRIFKRYNSGIKGLDDLLNNFYAGTLVTIGGLSGMGKTTFALNRSTSLPSTSFILCSSFLWRGPLRRVSIGS